MSVQSAEAQDTPDLHAFRLRARAYMAQHLPPRLAEELPWVWDSPELVKKDRRVQRLLFDGDLAGLTVPQAYGGQGLDASFEAIFLQEALPYRLPWALGVPFNVVLPTLLKCASEPLKQRYIPPILRGEDLWCQLLSEPSGGSDLAGLITRAVPTEGGWLLNGSKVWTTGGHYAEMGLCLARTDIDVPKHAGLSMFLVNMHAPGMTVRPLRLIDGGEDFCQEFLDDVFVPADHLVGEVNGGWAVAKTAMANEHAAMGRGWHIGYRSGETASELTLPPQLAELAVGRGHDPVARQLIGEAWVLDAVQLLTTRRCEQGVRTGVLPGQAGAIPKLMSARCGSRRTAIVSQLMGAHGVAARPGEAGVDAGLSRVTSHAIGGGTAEMSSNTIAEGWLGLPREPSPDRDLPFKDLAKNAPSTRGA
jgi:alkylation response protein AidB-like acyl-CoA dehydrogenase